MLARNFNQHPAYSLEQDHSHVPSKDDTKTVVAEAQHHIPWEKLSEAGPVDYVRGRSDVKPAMPIGWQIDALKLPPVTQPEHDATEKADGQKWMSFGLVLAIGVLAYYLFLS